MGLRRRHQESMFHGVSELRKKAMEISVVGSREMLIDALKKAKFVCCLPLDLITNVIS
jgi:hypothetical protein